jgi:HD-GYP domain-containing protein (c-di-GMP phosphodiesterase class II)
MINDQLYKGAIPEEIALAELHKNAGTQFDPKLVNAFATYLKEIK